MKRRCHLILVFSLVFVAVSCSSTGSGKLSSSSIPPASRKVRLISNAEERAIEYMPDVTAALRRAGFTVVGEGSAPYEVVVVFAGGIDLTCSIVMSERGVPIVSGKGVNTGFGTLIARDQAYRGVFDAALKQFSKGIGAL